MQVLLGPGLAGQVVVGVDAAAGRRDANHEFLGSVVVGGAEQQAFAGPPRRPVGRAQIADFDGLAEPMLEPLAELGPRRGQVALAKGQSSHRQTVTYAVPNVNSIMPYVLTH